MSDWKAVVATPDAGETEALIQELARRGLSSDHATEGAVEFTFSVDGGYQADADALVRDVVSTARQRAGMLAVDLPATRWRLEQGAP